MTIYIHTYKYKYKYKYIYIYIYILLIIYSEVGEPFKLLTERRYFKLIIEIFSYNTIISYNMKLR